MTHYFDTHAHYTDEAFDPDRDAVLTGLAALGVTHVVCPGGNLVSSAQCVALAERYPFLYAAVGVHPEDAGAPGDDYIAQLRRLATHPRVVAIGEIGLDYHYEDGASKELQRAVFGRQLALAGELGLPAIVHDRDAHEDCLRVVREHPGVTGVYHCYSGGVEDAKILVKMGWMLSFTGAITFKNARRAPEVIAQVPLEHLMIETDAPYLAPAPFRGGRNDSGYVHLVAEKIAELKGISAEEVARVTLENGKRFFRRMEQEGG